MTKFVAILFITSGLLACRPAAKNRQDSADLVKPPQTTMSLLKVTSRVLCTNSNRELLTYALSLDARYPHIEKFPLSQRILDYRMIASNGSLGQFLVAVVSDTDSARAEILLIDFSLERMISTKLLLGTVSIDSTSFFATSAGTGFALLTEDNGYILYDLLNRQRVRNYALNPNQFAYPRISQDGEFALLTHRLGKSAFRQILLSLTSGKGTPLPLVHSQSEPIDAQFISDKAIAWRESYQSDRLAVMKITDILSTEGTAPTFVDEPDQGAFASFYQDENHFIAIAGKTALRFVEFDIEAMKVTGEQSYGYPASLINDLPTIQSASWSNDILVGFDLLGKSLSFHTLNQTWLFQNCFFPRLGPETIVEIRE